VVVRPTAVATLGGAVGRDTEAGGAADTARDGAGVSGGAIVTGAMDGGWLFWETLTLQAANPSVSRRPKTSAGLVILLLIEPERLLASAA
jgi:hypothetical protein